MNEQHDWAAGIAALRIEQINPLPFAWPIGKVQLAPRTFSISDRSPLPVCDVNGVIGNAGPVVVLGLQVKFFGCHRDDP
jgi:hypothetical protein